MSDFKSKKFLINDFNKEIEGICTKPDNFEVCFVFNFSENTKNGCKNIGCMLKLIFKKSPIS